MKSDRPTFDVIIIGGSYAGLSAAMALGRSLRTVLIIDSGLACNRQTPHSHNFITQDGEQPHVIAEKARRQVLAYGTVQLKNDLATGAQKQANHFVVTTTTGDTYKAKKLIIATGIQDQLPDIKGFSACWGISVVHCPYCHGYEFRNKKTGIMANGQKAFHLASLVSNLTDNITILSAGKAEFSHDQLSAFSRHHINIIETPVVEIEHKDGQLNKVHFEDGSGINFDCVYAAVPFIQHSDIPQSLGCEMTEQGYIKIDNLQKTSVEGVYACGDNSAMLRSVANAVYAGNLTGAVVNRELTEATF